MSTTTIDLTGLRARREAVVKAHIEAEAVHHNVAAALATFEHPQYDVPALGGVVDGAAGVDGLLHALLAAYPDFWLRVGLERSRKAAPPSLRTAQDFQYFSTVISLGLKRWQIGYEAELEG